MRFLLLIVSTGCTTICPGHETVDGTWLVTASVIDATGGDDPDFPSYHSPSNGSSTWAVVWGREAVGGVSLAMDGQSMSAEGAYDSQECGAVQLALSGTYTGPNGSRHTFDADADVQVWDDQFLGTWLWSETWLSGDESATGTFETTGALLAERQR